MGLVDRAPFVIRGADHPKVPGKAFLYTEQEDDALREFAGAYYDVKITQQRLWAKAEKEDILPGRTAISMLKRYKKLTTTLVSPANSHYSLNDERRIRLFVYLWKTKKPGVPGMWKAAEENQVVSHRSANQMKHKYQEMLNKCKNKKEFMEAAKDLQVYVEDDWKCFTGL